MSQQILFVDDEERVLEGLRRMLRPMRDEWDMTFASSGAEALEVLARTHTDVIVSDMRMPGMDGAQLLAEAMARSPQTLRMALSGHSDLDTNLRCVRIAHQYLAKPCDPQVLKAAISRACALRAQMHEPWLQQLVTAIGVLPSRPDAYARLANELTRSAPSLAVAGKIVAGDMAMTAKTLQIVNSGFLGVGKSLTSSAAATLMLGVEALRWLLQVGVFQPAEFSDDGLWQHANAVQRNARAIALFEGWAPAAVDEVATTALLHDIGRLVLAMHFHQVAVVSAIAGAEDTNLGHAQRMAIEAAHATIGASLLGFWGLPEAMVDAVRDHHAPTGAAEPTLTTRVVVQIADALAHEDDPDRDGVAAPNVDALVPADCRDRLAEWRHACSEASEKETAG